MGLAVDTAREAADDHDPGYRQVAAERTRDLRPVARARAGADDGGRRSAEQFGRCGASQEQPDGWIVNGPKKRRELAIRPADERKPGLPERASVPRRVEASAKRCVALAVRDGDQMEPRLGGERRDREFVVIAASD